MAHRTETMSGKRYRVAREGDDLFLQVEASASLSPQIVLEQIQREYPESDLDVKQLVVALSSPDWTHIGHINPAPLSQPIVRLSPDRLTALLSLPPRWDNPNAVLDLCARIGVVHGLRIPAVKEAVHRSQEGEKVIDFPIAFGTPPLAGENGTIRFHFVRPEGKAQTDRKGRHEGYVLQSIIPVKQGDCLAEIMPPTEGREGRTVAGEILATNSPREAIPLYGDGVGRDGNLLVARASGCIVWRGGKITVEPLEILAGDCTGNYRAFEGAHLLIEGHVRDGAVVEADADIEIQGSIGRAHVTSHTGSITAAWGILGKGGAFVRAALDVRAGFVDEAIIEARALVVNEYLSRSLVNVREGVRIAGRRGLIASSSIKAEAHVLASNIRTLSPRDTRIDISGVPRLSLLVEYRILPHHIHALKRLLCQIEGQTDTFDPEAGLSGNLESLLAERDDIARRLADAQARLLELHNLLGFSVGDATLSLSGRNIGGFDLTMAGIPTHFDDGASGMLVYLDPVSRHLVLQKREGGQG